MRTLLVVILAASLAFGQAATPTQTVCNPQPNGSYLCEPYTVNGKRLAIGFAAVVATIVIIAVVRHHKKASANSRKLAKLQTGGR